MEALRKKRKLAQIKRELLRWRSSLSASSGRCAGEAARCARQRPRAAGGRGRTPARRPQGLLPHEDKDFHPPDVAELKGLDVVEAHGAVRRQAWQPLGDLQLPGAGRQAGLGTNGHLPTDRPRYLGVLTGNQFTMITSISGIANSRSAWLLFQALLDSCAQSRLLHVWESQSHLAEHPFSYPWT